MSTSSAHNPTARLSPSITTLTRCSILNYRMTCLPSQPPCLIALTPPWMAPTSSAPTSWTPTWVHAGSLLPDPPHLLQPGVGNHDDGQPRLPERWHRTLCYQDARGRTHTSSLTEVEGWVASLPVTPPTPSHTADLVASAGGHPDPPGSAGAPIEVTDTFTGPSSDPTHLNAPTDTTTTNPGFFTEPTHLNQDSHGKPLTMRTALAGPDGPLWQLAREAELIKLVRTTTTLVPTHSPAKSPTYYTEATKAKFNTATGITTRRVRGCAGGDRIVVPYSCATATASMALNKLHLNAVVSENAFFGTVDLVDYYLGAPLPTPESLRISLAGYSPSVLASLNLTPFIKHDSHHHPYIFFDIHKTIAGLPQSGLLSQNRLITLLNSGGYFETATPMLFRHTSRPIDFTLVVDDFGIKYHHRDDFDHLVALLGTLYGVKPHPVGTNFLGYTIVHDRVHRTITMSYPGYISSLLDRVRPLGIKPAASPSIYVPPVYGSRAPQTTTVDTSNPATTA